MAQKQVKIFTSVQTTTTVQFDEVDLNNILVHEARRMGLVGPVIVDWDISPQGLLRNASVTLSTTDRKEEVR